MREDGSAFLMAADMQWDSFQLRAALAEALSGGFHIQHVSAGSYLAADDLRMPGWKIVLEPADVPEPVVSPAP